MRICVFFSRRRLAAVSAGTLWLRVRALRSGALAGAARSQSGAAAGTSALSAQMRGGLSKKLRVKLSKSE